jgi:hypothetical protein
MTGGRIVLSSPIRCRSCGWPRGKNGKRAERTPIVESPALEAWQVEPTDSLAIDAYKINGTPD